MEDNSIISSWLKCNCCRIIFENNMGDHKCEKIGTDPSKIRKIDGLETLPTTSYSSLLPYQTPQVKETLEKLFSNVKPKTIIDCTCHIGGDVLNFAEIFPESNIVAIDNDIKALFCLSTNIIKRGLSTDRFKLIHADSSEWIKKVQYPADLYYFDPPWGGPSYSLEDTISLYIGDKNIVEIINYIFDRKLSKYVLLKAPRNFAYNLFCKEVKGTIDLYQIKKPKKGNEIAYLLLLITFS